MGNILTKTRCLLRPLGLGAPWYGLRASTIGGECHADVPCSQTLRDYLLAYTVFPRRVSQYWVRSWVL